MNTNQRVSGRIKVSAFAKNIHCNREALDAIAFARKVLVDQVFQ